MLISLLALLAMAVSTGIRSLMAEGTIALEGPSTLELGLIGGSIIVVYAVVTRAAWRRRTRIHNTRIGDPLTLSAQPTATVEAVESVESEAAKEPSRGAA
jgi:hypothetical protein